MAISLSPKTVKMTSCFLCVILFLSLIFPIRMPHAATIYCLETKKKMYDKFKNAIINNIDDPDTDILHVTIYNCWNKTEKDSSLNEEIGPLLMRALRDPNISKNIKRYCFTILRHIAPDNIFYDLINYLGTNSNELDPSTQISLLSTIFEIRSRAATKNPQVANYDIKKLIDDSRELFNEDSPALEGLIHALTIKYPFDYPKAKEELNYLDLLDLSKRYRYGYGLFNFYDPRALEDDLKYDSYLNSRQYTSARMFTSILRHLEMEFKAEWLNKLQTDELRILRNAIYASYGYKFTNQNLRKYFYEENRMTYICRNGRCGQPKIKFNEKLLNEIDRKNLVLIKEIEKNGLPR